MNKPLANEAMQDQALVKQMRALEQAEPSAELDAAILQQIEAALREEANVNSQAQANSKSSTENRETSAPITSLTAAPTWFDRLRQWWYLPLAAMASLVLAVNLMHSDSTATDEISVPTLAKTEKNTRQQAELETKNSTPNSDSDKSSSIEALAEARRVEFTRNSNAADSRANTAEKNNSIKTALAKADMVTSKTSNPHSMGAEKTVASVSAPPAFPPIAPPNFDPKLTTETKTTMSETSTMNQTSPPVVARSSNIAEASDRDQSSQTKQRVVATVTVRGSDLRVPITERTVENTNINKEIEVATTAEAAVPNSSAPQAKPPIEKNIAVNLEAPKLAASRSVQVTGSRVRSGTPDTYVAAINEKTTSQAGGESNLAAPNLAAAPPSSIAPSKTMDVPVSQVATSDLALAKPMILPTENLNRQGISMMSKQQKTDSTAANEMLRDIEQLLDQHKEPEALVMWRQFKQQYPQHRLPVDLAKRLHNIEKIQEKK